MTTQAAGQFAGHRATARLECWEPSFEVHVTIDRQAFGLRWNQDLDTGGVVVGDRIDVEVRVQALRVSNDATKILAS